MKRGTFILLAIGLIGGVGPRHARGGFVSFSNTPFTTTVTTDFHDVTRATNLPYTDALGNTITANAGTSGDVYNFFGLSLSGSGLISSIVLDVTFTLAAPTNQIAFNFTRDLERIFLQSASFSNGDNFTGGPNFTVSGKFLNLSDTDAFTSVNLKLRGGSGTRINDFRVAPSVVAEPSSLSLAGAFLAVACVAGRYLRKKTRRATAG